MIKCIFLTVKLSLASIILLAQSTELMQIIPPSPTSQEFDKYINHEVSLYNGVPEISVPLYEIPMGRTTIPVRLEYHASGIKYGQASGEVGVGWVLQPGYRISRTIYGRADEFFEKPAITELSSFGGNQPRDQYLTNFISWGDPDLPVPTAYYDGEFDLFTYSTLADAGTFFIKDRLSRHIQLVSHSNLSINYSVAQDGSLDYFDVKDGSGNKYRYGKSLGTAGLAIERNLDPNSGSTRSSWLLTDIEDPFGNYAAFSYQTFQEYDDRTGGESLIVSPGFLELSCAEQYASIYTPPDNQTSVVYEVQRIDQIETAEVTAIFYRHSAGGMLDSIVVNSNLSQERIRKIEFHYSNNGIHTFLDSVLLYGENDQEPVVYEFEYKGKNDFSGTHGYLAADYWGYYKLNSEPYPQYPDFEETYICDISSPISLGSYMHKINRNPEMNEADLFTLEKITYPTGGSTLYEFESNKYEGYRDDGPGNVKYAGIRIKQIVSDDSQGGGILKRLFTYGVNESGLGNVNIDIAVNSWFIGYRLGVICVNYGANLNEVLYGMERTFNQTFTNEVGSALGSPVQYANVTEYQIKPSYTNPSFSTTNGKIEYEFELSSDVSQSLFSNNSQFDAIEGIRYGSNPTCIGNGFVTFQGGLNPYIVGYEKWNKSVLRSKSVFSSIDTEYRLISKDSFIYEIKNHTSFDGLKVRRFVSGGTYLPTQDYYANGLNSLFEYAKYYVNCANKVLTKKVSRTYYGEARIQQETQLSYNDDFQLAMDETENSDGSIITTTYKYPADFVAITATDEVSSGIQNLKDEHVLNNVIEKVVELRHPGVTSRHLVSAIFHSYHNNKSLASKVMAVHAAGIVADFSPAFVSDGSITYDGRYEDVLLFDRYDDSGNILQQNRVDNFRHSYIWGYNGKYLIAEVLNAFQKDLFYTSFEDSEGNSNETDSKTGRKSRVDGYQKSLFNLSNGLYALTYWKKSGGDWIYEVDEVDVTNNVYTIELLGQIDEVRFYPVDAQMTTFTYNSSECLTSRTDMNGLTTYYEYDGLGRLVCVKDNNGNIIKSYSYHYRSQSQ